MCLNCILDNIIFYYPGPYNTPTINLNINQRKFKLLFL